MAKAPGCNPGIAGSNPVVDSRCGIEKWPISLAS